MNFLSIDTTSLNTLNLNVLTGWSDKGNPLVTVSTDTVLPKDLFIRTVIYPSGYQMSSDLIQVVGTQNQTLTNLCLNSGYKLDEKTVTTDLVKYNHTFDFGSTLDYSNSYYKLAYYLEYRDTKGTLVRPPVFQIVNSSYLVPSEVPRASNIGVSSYIVSSGSYISRLNLDITGSTELHNKQLSVPSPYLVTISGVDGYYNRNGYFLPSSTYDSSNYFNSYSSGILLSLVTSNGQITTSNDMSIIKDYNITLYNLDQLGNKAPTGLSFNTKNIRKTLYNIDAGSIDYFSNTSSPAKSDLFDQEVTSNEILKKRFSIGINNLALYNIKYSKTGTYISDFYTTTSPIYTFMFRVNEYIPNYPGSNKYDILKYFVEFNNQDWLEISPTNRTEELVAGTVIPKLYIFDTLDTDSVRSNVRELHYDFSVYSFRIKIVFDVSLFVDDLYSSPEIRSYECLISDRGNF